MVSDIVLYQRHYATADYHHHEYSGTEGLGKYTALGSGIFMMMVVGGGIMPLIQNYIADHYSYMVSYIVPLLSMAYISFYAIKGSKR